MKIECIHGYFKFSETQAGQISHFCSLYGLTIERSGDHFTFEDLVDAPRHSLPGGTFLGAPTTVLFEGDPWDVMRENGLVYDFNAGEVVLLASILTNAPLSAAGYYYVSTGMILPGSVMDDGSRVTDYSAHFLLGRENFKYSEVGYV